MYLSINELLNNLDNEVMSLNVNPKFKENPAYQAILTEIGEILRKVNVDDGLENSKIIRKNNEQISMELTNKNGQSCQLAITCNGSSEINCLMTWDDNPSFDQEGKRAIGKISRQVTGNLQENGNINLVKNYATIDDAHCEKGELNTFDAIEQEMYTAQGVMYRKDSLASSAKNYYRNTNFEPSTLFYKPGIFMQPAPLGLVQRSVVQRKTFDTADVYIKNADRVTFNGVVALDREHGLSKMNPILPTEDYIISPLSVNEVEEIIKQENNPKVQEGLRKFTHNREYFSYDSALDLDYVNVNQYKVQESLR